MAKKRKPSGKAAATRRPTRRGKQNESAPSVDGETSGVAEQAPPDDASTDPPPPAKDNALPVDPTATEGTSISDQNSRDTTSNKPITIPTLVVHKKFGKYRCLFSNDDSCTKKYDVGSDSETNSLDNRAIEPCASSESDSNAGVETQSDTVSGTCTISPVSSLSVLQSPAPPLNETAVNKNVIPQMLPNATTDIENIELELPMSEQILESYGEPKMQETTDSQVEETMQQDEDDDDDDEVITVVQIVEDDYYSIQITSPKETESEVQEGESKEPSSDFQQHFEKLNIDTHTSGPNSPMDCTEQMENRLSGCNTPDLSFSSKEQLSEGMQRPDPSVTPSSTLSDDSNSSRVNSEQNLNNSNDSSESSPTGVRRSSRIKTISTLKQKTKGYGLVKTPLKKALMSQTKLKLEELGSDSQEKMNEPPSNSNSPTFPVPLDMPVKVKSRWRRSSELEMGAGSPVISPLASPSLPNRLPAISETEPPVEEEKVPLSKEAYDKIIEDRMSQYQHLDDNEYLCERMISKETKKMICDCFLTKEEIERGELGCGEDCLNRLLMIECNYRCPVGDRCTNRRFQKMQNGPLKVFYADKKGCGVEAVEDIPSGEYLMEYIGEVLDYELFYKRAQAYSDENNLHHYFMSLKGDTVIDATLKGNISRFINHSCDPNAETQKWTVNGELRIGFFSKRDIVAGEEITFDYQFQRFGKEAQRCYCGADNCRGWIGAEPDSDEEDDEEEDDVSTSKLNLSSSEDQTRDPSQAHEQPAVRKRKPRRDRRKYSVPAPDLVQDADIEEDIEALSRTGVKNQSHTLRLSRTMVRAKGKRAQVLLLRLLRDADLPCRRLFLDYRGLRLLAPWCTDAARDFKLEMLQTVDRLPIPNKTMVQESRFISVVERWLSAADVATETPLFIDEATGLPIEIPNKPQDKAVDKAKDPALVVEKVKELSKQLLERWSSLKEVFKIPKKERIQQMKEHERQANVERRAADSSGSRERERSRDERERNRDDRERNRDDRERNRDDRERTRDDRRDDYRDRDRERDKHRERDRERDREREKDRERDERDRRKRRGSPEGRRSIRLSERVLAPVPPMSKEERRRAFAEAAAAAEEERRSQHSWTEQLAYMQMFGNQQNMPGGPPNMVGGPPNMIGGPPNMVGGAPNMVGGPPNMVGGPPNMVGGPPNMLGPPNMIGPPGMMPQNMPPGMIPNMAQMGPNMGPNMPPNMGQLGPTMGQMGPNMGQMGPNMGQMGPNMGQMGPNMGQIGGMPPGMMGGEEWAGGEFPPQFIPPFAQQPFCMTQANFMSMGGYGPLGFMFGQDQPLMPTAVNIPQESQEVLAPVEEEVVLPSLWRSAVDERGRTYYYHVKLRQPQWVPPPPPPPTKTDNEESESEEEEVAMETSTVRKPKMVEGVKGIYEVIKEDSHNGLIPDHALLKPRKRRPGLVTERPISPRTEEDKLAGRLEVKRYKETKEKLRKRRERLLQKFKLLQQASKKGSKIFTHKDLQMADLIDSDTDTDSDEEDPIELPPEPVEVAEASPEVPEVVVEVPNPEEAARKIKETFRSSMARVMVNHLNPYRHRTAPFGRITNTNDFKHLARKLTHFVMLKELKHCRTIEELIVSDSVRSKAKEFVKKYMAKFGPVYKRPAEEVD